MDTVIAIKPSTEEGKKRVEDFIATSERKATYKKIYDALQPNEKEIVESMEKEDLKIFFEAQGIEKQALLEKQKKKSESPKEEQSPPNQNGLKNETKVDRENDDNDFLCAMFLPTVASAIYGVTEKSYDKIAERVADHYENLRIQSISPICTMAGIEEENRTLVEQYVFRSLKESFFLPMCSIGSSDETQVSLCAKMILTKYQKDKVGFISTADYTAVKKALDDYRNSAIKTVIELLSEIIALDPKRIQMKVEENLYKIISLIQAGAIQKLSARK